MALMSMLRPQHSPKKTERGNGGANLMNLPSEILQIIIEYLSPADRASLTLCSHVLLWALGNKYWSSLRSGKEDEDYRESFLTTLARDLPGHFFCHHCSRLHLWHEVGPPGPALQPKNRLPCVEDQLELWRCVRAHLSMSRYRFVFPHLQLAMRRHYYGPGHGIPTESLSFTEVQVHIDEDKPEQVTTLLSVEARICLEPTSLSLRIQQWALIDSAKRDLMLLKTKFVMVCDHVTTRSAEISRLIESKLKRHHTESVCRLDSEVLKCRYCNIDFQVQIKEVGNEGTALVITKWLDLGPGLTPMDTTWRVHLARDRDAEIGKSRKAGAIRLRFESEPGLSQNSLSHQNASYLIEKRFKGAMDHWYDRTWILQAGKRLPFYTPGRIFFLAILVADLSLVLAAWCFFFA